MNVGIKFIILILCFLTKNSISLKSSDFCAQNRQTCTLKSDLNKVVCQQQACNSKFPHECGKKYCTSNQTACRVLMNLNERVNSVKVVHSFLEFIHQRENNEYTRFIRIISACSIKERQIDWSPASMCVNTFTCKLRHDLGVKYSVVTYVKWDECRCEGSFSYKCGKVLCAKNRQACDDMDQFKEHIDAGSLGINQCKIYNQKHLRNFQRYFRKY